MLLHGPVVKACQQEQVLELDSCQNPALLAGPCLLARVLVSYGVGSRLHACRLVRFCSGVIEWGHARNKCSVLHRLCPRCESLQ